MSPPDPRSGSPARSIRRCARHRERDAVHRCQKCRMTWCGECVKSGNDRGIAWASCSCGGRCAPVEVEAAPPEPTFEQSLGDAFAYPFRGDGRWLLLVGTVVYGLLDLFYGAGLRRIVAAMMRGDPGGVNMLDFIVGASGVALVLLFFGYQLSWVMRVIRHSARGDSEMPGFPEFTTFAESVMLPLGQGLALIGLTLLPPLLLLPFGPLGFFGGIALFVAGAVVLPMALLSVAMAGSLEGLDWPRILRSIPAAGAPFGLAATLFFVVAAFTVFGSIWLEAVPIAGPLVRVTAILYLSAVAGRMLGLAYARRRRELGWYEDPGT